MLEFLKNPDFVSWYDTTKQAIISRNIYFPLTIRVKTIRLIAIRIELVSKKTNS